MKHVRKHLKVKSSHNFVFFAFLLYIFISSIVAIIVGNELTRRTVTTQSEAAGPARVTIGNKSCLKYDCSQNHNPVNCNNQKNSQGVEVCSRVGVLSVSCFAKYEFRDSAITGKTPSDAYRAYYDCQDVSGGETSSPGGACGAAGQACCTGAPCAPGVACKCQSGAVCESGTCKTPGSGDDSACTSGLGGTCKFTSQGCSGNWVSGKCLSNSSSSYRCCVPGSGGGGSSPSGGGAPAGGNDGIGASCSAKGQSGTCQRSCNGTKVPYSQGASGCQNFANDIQCCVANTGQQSSGNNDGIGMACKVGNTGGTCQRTCTGGTKHPAKIVGGNAEGCEPYPNDVQCCIQNNASQPKPAGEPRGWVDKVDCTRVKGWAFDPDTPQQSIQVHLYVGGRAGSPNVEVHNVAANIFRADVKNYPEFKNYNLSGNHGFDWPLPAKYLDGKSRDIFVYAIDSAGGNNPEVGFGTTGACTGSGSNNTSNTGNSQSSQQSSGNTQSQTNNQTSSQQGQQGQSGQQGQTSGSCGNAGQRCCEASGVRYCYAGSCSASNICPDISNQGGLPAGQQNPGNQQGTQQQGTQGQTPQQNNNGLDIGLNRVPGGVPALCSGENIFPNATFQTSIESGAYVLAIPSIPSDIKTKYPDIKYGLIIDDLSDGALASCTKAGSLDKCISPITAGDYGPVEFKTGHTYDLIYYAESTCGRVGNITTKKVVVN